MNINKVWFSFFIIFALTINYGFFVGDLDKIEEHNVWELFFAILVSLIAFLLKLGDKSHIGHTQLATSMVASIHLIIAAFVWGFYTSSNLPLVEAMPTIVSLSGGAFIANIISVILLITEAIIMRR